MSDLHSQFVGMVARGRNIPEERVREIADGRVVTGRQAVSLGLVDAIGGEAEARGHLATAHGIAREVPVRDLRTRDLTDRAFGASLAEAFGEGMAAGVARALKTFVLEGVGVDGIRALWQPPGTWRGASAAR
ncbi:S49 family peptidase [Roseomonas sp. CCTCC AB2023176]|uniref:S49 family peptidase n=1 Tax=Roseomonas sp. CCTCC AB2023176 TaxID=3342640 RepID=UPI0035D95B99